MQKFLFLFFLSLPAFADTITLIEPLNLGRFAIIKNTTPSTITVDIAGRTSSTNSIGVIEAGYPAEYLLTTFPPLTYLNITPTILSPQTTSIVAPPSSGQFTVINIETPTVIQTDISGTATLYVGLTYQTSGIPTDVYYDAPYTANYLISIDY